MTIKDLIRKVDAKDEDASMCHHFWVPQGKSSIDPKAISSMRCTLCGESRASTEEENQKYA